jgi:hypothetical protein
MVLYRQDHHLRWSRVVLCCGALLLPAPALVVIGHAPQMSIASHGYCARRHDPLSQRESQCHH